MNDEFRTRTSSMLFKDRHKVCFTISHELRKVINREVLLIIVINEVNQFTNLFIFTISIISVLAKNVTIVKEQIEELSTINKESEKTDDTLVSDEEAEKKLSEDEKIDDTSTDNKKNKK